MSRRRQHQAAYKYEMERLQAKILRNSSFSSMWEEHLPKEQIEQVRTMLLSDTQRRARFIQLAFTSIVQLRDVGPLPSSSLAMGRFLFGIAFEEYHPSINEARWREQVSQSFREVTTVIGSDQADELLSWFESQMHSPTSLSFLDEVLFEGLDEAE